jgi:uncharacterized protein (DUF1015 family)
MATVRPFRALRYDLERAQLARVLAPAAELIDDDARAALYEREPRNATRVVSSKAEHGEGPKVAAQREAFHLAEWRRARVLKEDDYAAFYVLRQTLPTVDDDDEPQVVEGFFAVVDLDDRAPDELLAHEEAVAEDVAIACERLATLGHHVDPVLLVHDDKKGRVQRALRSEADRDPDARAELDGNTYELWVIDDESATARVAALLEERKLYAAAGDTRLHAAMALEAERSSGGEGRAPTSLLAWITSTEQAAGLIRPVHRAGSWMGTRDIPAILGESQRWFRRTEVAPGQELRDAVVTSEARVAFGLWLREGGCFAFELLEDIDDSELPGFDDGAPVDDAEVVQRVLLQGLFGLDTAYGDVRAVRDDAIDLAMIDGAGNDLAVFMRAPSLQQLIERVDAGQPLPSGSTTVAPLPPAGMVFTSLVAPSDEEE